MYDLFYVGYESYSDKNWQLIKQRFPHAKKVSGIDNIHNMYLACANKSFTRMFWTIDSGIVINDEWNFDYVPPTWDQLYIHIWLTKNNFTSKEYDLGSGYGTVKLWPKELILKNKDDIPGLLSKQGHLKVMQDSISTAEMNDMFFVSYEEESADRNYELLKNRFPNVKRIHGIKGINEAHKECAKQSSTKMFWTIDGDTLVDDTWDFSFNPPAWDQDYIHLWHSRNPINDLEYGYGAIKLWPKNKVLNHNGNWLDFTTSISGIKIVPNTVATTAFNTSEYSTWKSAFRESIKLCTNILHNREDQESRMRLEIWKLKAKVNQPYSNWSLIGASDAIEWFDLNKDNVKLINDFQWLRNMFVFKYGDK